MQAACVLLQRALPTKQASPAPGCRAVDDRSLLRPVCRWPAECGVHRAAMLQAWRSKWNAASSTFIYELAGAEFIGGVIGAGAEIVARTMAAYRHTVAGAGGGIADAEIGKEAFLAQIYQAESLLAPELPTQRALPVYRRQIGGCMDTREPGAGFRLGCGAGIAGSGFYLRTDSGMSILPCACARAALLLLGRCGRNTHVKAGIHTSASD